MESNDSKKKVNLFCCPQCNYAISEIKIKEAITDFPCPRCWLSKVSNFYALGSTKHKKILEGSCIQSAPARIFLSPLPLSFGR